MKTTLLVLTAALLAATPAAAQTAADSAGIRAAALDYIEGWYEGNADRMSRAVHPDLAKRIVLSGPDGATRVASQGAQRLVDDTRTGYGKNAPDRRTDVRILDVYGKAASVRIDAGGWVDYLHLGRVDGKWVIINVLWEQRPRAGSR